MRSFAPTKTVLRSLDEEADLEGKRR